MTTSHLDETLSHLSARAASSVIARGRLASSALNAALLRRLCAGPGARDSLLADPVFEAARTWESADRSLDDLSGGLLHPDLVAALDGAEAERMPRDRCPWTHQLAAWEATRAGLSCLVSSGTGSGKTECFMVPMLDELLRDPAKGKLAGVRAILIYPLNALIESQRERLAAWTETLKSRISFALYNGLTPETPRRENRSKLAAAEVGNRRSIRASPPAILVTNVTMLEYLLLRTQDRTILEQSQGLLRWIVLDEAHSYIGAQAAEMALLLRRVRAAFGVAPDQVRLMATSATISEGEGTEAKLRRFVSGLAGLDEGRVRVIEGRAVEPELPPTQEDTPLEPRSMDGLDSASLWEILAPHPRVRALKLALSEKSVTLTEVATILFGPSGIGRKAEAQALLDAAARATHAATGVRLLPWRAHIFHRSLGGLWVCVDANCQYRDPELSLSDSGWGYGAVWLKQRDTCECGAPVFEIFACNECGAPHLLAGLEAGASARLVPLRAIGMDDFAVDIEPDTEIEDAGPVATGTVILSPARNDSNDRFVKLDDGTVFDNAPPQGARSVRLALEENESARTCCPGAAHARLAPQRYGPPFFMGTAVPALIESLAQPMDRSGLPMGGRRGITFSDSRQGTARLAAKLQQDAERNLTRAFLYHAVQEDRGPEGEERTKLEKRLASFRKINDPEFADDIRSIEAQLAGNAVPIPWTELVDRFAQQSELREFATDVWRERARGGREMANEPSKLAEMFLYRELFRRPKVQNNAETMGLLRLSFPKLEEKALARLPRVLEDAGIDTDGWLGLALTAVDFVFRDQLATRITPDWMIRFVSPRTGRQPNTICRPGLDRANRPAGGRPWPSPNPHLGRASRVHRLLYALIGGHWEKKEDQDRASEVLTLLWSLIASTAARDIGGGAFQLDFKNAAVARLDHGWLCPVTRRIFGYSPAGRSPYDPDRLLSPIELPRPPAANAGGLDPHARTEAIQWCETDARIADLRQMGLWTDLHDRVVAYSPFLRAQEHSAQIERPVLAIYEERFKEGRINLLNCSTTMEMGVDIPNVRIVVNANVPPSVSNYRQRVGRAGRRGEPWTFGVTFCRDLPLDQIVFENPTRLLSAPVTAPSVNFDSTRLVARHVHAALLAAFLREQPDGFNLKASTGACFGATEDADVPVASASVADAFLDALRGDWGRNDVLASTLGHLTRGTSLDGQDAAYLAAETAEAFETMLGRWRGEYSELLARREAAAEPEVKRAFQMRARRMKGEFILGELARRGFTPSYGFPVDVVSFDHLSGHDRDREADVIAFGEYRGGASRTLDVAIREYAPGAEIVVDGLVHRSEGVFPAWGAMADASNLEDLQDFWECPSCRYFELARIVPEVCPHCDSPVTSWKRCLRPAGFLGRRAPHTGYENLGHAAYEMPRLSAGGSPWRALPDPEAGRMRADPDGQVITLGSGPNGKGYALCLSCGRAEAETEEGAGSLRPPQIRRHWPLAEARGMRLAKGYCPGGTTEPQRIQPNVRLSHASRTDVFELQLPNGARRDQGLALAAALREALTERLGAEAREIGVAVGHSAGPSGENRVSALLYDRASGGAGLALRLSDQEWFDACLEQALGRLSCPEDCTHGCPACVLRSDLSFEKELLDRRGGRLLAQTIRDRLRLPDAMRIFGPDTRFTGLPLTEWIERRSRAGGLSAISLYLHGSPSDWELAAWPVAERFARLKASGINVELVLESRTLSDKSMDLAQQLDLHRLSPHASLKYVSDLPRAGDALVVAVITDAKGRTAIAAHDSKDAVPGPQWGHGAEVALVQGIPPELPATQSLADDWLVKVSSGNAHLIRPGIRLNGRVASFGSTFWRVLAEEAPLTVAAIRAHKVHAVTYTDRYLLTPLALRLLVEVVRKMPGAGATSLYVSTARLSRPERRGWAVFHTFADDATRRNVLQALLPNAQIDLRGKAELPHARSFALRLGDGRNVTILLDQGFGAWRAQGVPKYDFGADPAKQVRLLKSLDFAIGVEPGAEAPIVLEEKLRG